MLDLAWPSLVILALTALTIILTVLIGIRGLHTNLVRSGKLTRKGRALALAMCGLGALTYALGLGDRIIAHQKEKQEARERERLSRQQMAKLEQATRSLEQLQNGMRNSLRRQEQLYGVADRSLRMSEALQQQNQTNTLAVLRRVFEESNRVSAERIAISVSYRCPETEELSAGPVEIKTALISVSGGGRQAARLSTGEKVDLSGGSVFHGFLGDLGSFEAFPAWRVARVTIRLAASRIGTFFTMDDLRRYEEAKQRLGREPGPPVCPTTITLFLNGRQVLGASGELRALPNDDDSFLVEFADLRVDQSRLPRYPN